MLPEAKAKEGLVAEKEEVNLFVKETTQMIQNLRRKLTIILLV